MVWFGYKNAMLDLGSYRMPWLIPLDRLYRHRADLRRAGDAVLRRADRQWMAATASKAPRTTSSCGAGHMNSGAIIVLMGSLFLVFGYMGVPVTFAHHGRRAGRDRVHPGQLPVDDRPDVPRHRFRDTARDPVLPSGRRIDDVGRRDAAPDPAGAGAGRASARRPRAGRDTVQHVLRRNFRLVRRRRRGPEPHRRAGDGQGALRPRLHRGADRLGLDHREPDPALDHGGGLWRDRQRIDRRPVSRRHRAGRA